MDGARIMMAVETTRFSDLEPVFMAVPSMIPCDCGLEFDDVHRSTIYPHDWIPSRIVERARDQVKGAP